MPPAPGDCPTQSLPCSFLVRDSYLLLSVPKDSCYFGNHMRWNQVNNGLVPSTCRLEPTYTGGNSGLEVDTLPWRGAPQQGHGRQAISPALLAPRTFFCPRSAPPSRESALQIYLALPSYNCRSECDVLPSGSVAVYPWCNEC